MLWYRAKTYCPVIDSLQNEPEMWVDGNAYKRHRQNNWKPRFAGDSVPYVYADNSSLYHKELHIEITNWKYSTYTKTVLRKGHTLPVSKHRLKVALNNRLANAAKAVKQAALAELNRVTQDAQTLRIKRIAQLRQELANQEAADFAYRLEHAG